MTRWYAMKADAQQKAAEILIYDMIGRDWWTGEGVDAKSFHEDLKALGDVETITLRVNSPGGDVMDGVTIFNLLDQHPARVVAQIDGIAASAASLIVMAADEIVMPDNSFMLIHEPRSWAMGTAQDMEAVAADLSRMTETFAATYAKRSGKLDADAVKALMKEDRLMTASEAQESGFADRVAEPVKMAASFDPKRLPKMLRDKIAPAIAMERAESAPQVEQPAAPQPPQPAPDAESNVVALDSARKEGREAGRVEATEIAELCALAGAPEKTREMIQSGKSMAQIRKLLVDMKADQSATDVAGQRASDAIGHRAVPWDQIVQGVQSRFGKR